MSIGVPARTRSERGVDVWGENGKVRGKLEVAKDTPKDEVISKAKEIDVVKGYLTDDPKKTIFVPNKLVNFVV